MILAKEVRKGERKESEKHARFPLVRESGVASVAGTRHLPGPGV